MDTTQSPAPRTPLHIDVEFRKSYARDESSATLKNISLSGAFLKHGTESLKVGEKLSLRFQVSGRERMVPAQVVWTNKQGSGIKFMPQNNRDTQIVDDLIYYVENKRTDHKDVLDKIFKKVA
jgi:hypothetical protein